MIPRSNPHIDTSSNPIRPHSNCAICELHVNSVKIVWILNTVHDDHKKVYMVYNYIHNKLQSHENCYHNQHFETLTVLCQICMAIPLIWYDCFENVWVMGSATLTFLGFLSHLEFSHRASPSISWGLRKHCLARSCRFADFCWCWNFWNMKNYKNCSRHPEATRHLMFGETWQPRNCEKDRKKAEKSNADEYIRI